MNTGGLNAGGWFAPTGFFASDSLGQGGWSKEIAPAGYIPPLLQNPATVTPGSVLDGSPGAYHWTQPPVTGPGGSPVQLPGLTVAGAAPAAAGTVALGGLAVRTSTLLWGAALALLALFLLLDW